MPIFPPVRTIVAKPTTMPTPTLMGGYSYDEDLYPLTNLIDKTSQTAWRSPDNNVAVRFDFGTTTQVSFVGIVGHSLTPGTLCSVHASNLANPLNLPPYPPDDEFSQSWVENLVLSRAFASRMPNCWVDTRDVAGEPTVARFWQVHVHNNGGPVTISEIVFGTGYEFHGVVKLPFGEQVTAKQRRQRTDTGAEIVSASGAVVREMDLTLILTPEEQENLRFLYDSIWQTNDLRAVIIPSTSVNDLWYVELQNLDVLKYPHAILEGEHRLTMVEEVFGVV